MWMTQMGEVPACLCLVGFSCFFFGRQTPSHRCAVNRPPLTLTGHWEAPLVDGGGWGVRNAPERGKRPRKYGSKRTMREHTSRNRHEWLQMQPILMPKTAILHMKRKLVVLKNRSKSTSQHIKVNMPGSALRKFPSCHAFLRKSVWYLSVFPIVSAKINTLFLRLRHTCRGGCKIL